MEIDKLEIVDLFSTSEFNPIYISMLLLRFTGIPGTRHLFLFKIKKLVAFFSKLERLCLTKRAMVRILLAVF